MASEEVRLWGQRYLERAKEALLSSLPYKGKRVSFTSKLDDKPKFYLERSLTAYAGTFAGLDDLQLEIAFLNELGFEKPRV